MVTSLEEGASIIPRIPLIVVLYVVKCFLSHHHTRAYQIYCEHWIGFLTVKQLKTVKTTVYKNSEK